MADLRRLYSGLGLTNITTYIQSGNVLFDSPTEEGQVDLAYRIEQAIYNAYGFEVPVIVRTAEDLEKAISANPFYQPDAAAVEGLHLTFLKVAPAPDKRDSLQTFDSSPDQFEIIENNVFISCAGKYSDSKLSNQFFEGKLKVPATTRNWSTILKLAELSRS